MGRVKLTGQVRLDASGDGRVTLTARQPFTVTHTRLTVAPLSGQTTVLQRPKGVVYVTGDEFEDTYSGHRASSDTVYPLEAGDTVECQWTGGDAGALATLIVRGAA